MHGTVPFSGTGVPVKRPTLPTRPQHPVTPLRQNAPAQLGGLLDERNRHHGPPATPTAKPNLMFILDDSGSMSWDFMPDWVDINNDTLVAGLLDRLKAQAKVKAVGKARVVSARAIPCAWKPA